MSEEKELLIKIKKHLDEISDETEEIIAEMTCEGEMGYSDLLEYERKDYLQYSAYNGLADEILYMINSSGVLNEK